MMEQHRMHGRWNDGGDGGDLVKKRKRLSLIAFSSSACPYTSLVVLLQLPFSSSS